MNPLLSVLLDHKSNSSDFIISNFILIFICNSWYKRDSINNINFLTKYLILFYKKRHNTTREVKKMAKSPSRKAVPQAKAALDQFKYEVANEIGVPLKQGYNGDLTSAQAGSVGGYMVKKMIEKQEQQMAGTTPVK
jgi:hypothetical protein